MSCNMRIGGGYWISGLAGGCGGQNPVVTTKTSRSTPVSSIAAFASGSEAKSSSKARDWRKSLSMPSIRDVYPAPHSPRNDCSKKPSASSEADRCDNNRFARSFLKNASNASFAKRCLNTAMMLPMLVSKCCGSPDVFSNASSRCLARSFATDIWTPAFRNASNASLSDRANSQQPPKEDAKTSCAFLCKSMTAGMMLLAPSGVFSPSMIFAPIDLITRVQAARTACVSPTSPNNLNARVRSATQCPSTRSPKPLRRMSPECRFTNSARTRSTNASAVEAWRCVSQNVRSCSTRASQCCKYDATGSFRRSASPSAR
mmetsp:Transcript_27921/g.80049  ORF Transcript_27921/g.80049 Transcript_27921/m.80049 type:complete len:316 (+) Transcript_27921:780-1727(+)